MDEKRHRVHVVLSRTGRGTVEVNGQAIEPSMIRAVSVLMDLRQSDIPLVTLTLVGDVIVDAADVQLEIESDGQ